MATPATLPSGPPTANRRIFNILQGAMKISRELRETLECAAEAFRVKSYKSAAKYFKTAFDLWNAKDEKLPNQIIILIKYMLCMCWLESTDAKALLNSLETLEELERNYGYEYPMLYYAVGKAYFKLYRFNKADEMVKKGFAVLNGDINVIECNIPGTKICIPESSREHLVAALVSLNDQCSSWHRPDAVCCMTDCSSYSQNEGADKNIFFGNPTFNGMVQVSCNNTSNFCIMNFHTACWKAKKEQLCSLRKISDKDVLNWECFTPNCENQGLRCTIKKIEIFDEKAEVKASIEPRTDDVAWHAKPNSTPKGAIRKQQQQQTPKVKAPSAESRAITSDRSSRLQSIPNGAPTHNNTATHRMKVEDNEEDEDFHDEQALKASIEKLVKLRANNFDIKDEEIWQPNLQMYGNKYMLATAELVPDPDFTNEGVEEADLKAFFFSYFYTFISENGPVKLDALADKWNEAKNIAANCDSVLNHYIDIAEFLLQSVKFATVGNYICVADKLPKAYDLAKNDTCEILRFFIENDIDQHSNSSSIDDEAVFNDMINQEKNNNSLPCLPVSEDAQIITTESSAVLDASTDIDRKDYEKSIRQPKDTNDVKPNPPLPLVIPKIESFPKSDSNSQENGQISGPEAVEASTPVKERKPIVPSQLSAEKDVKFATPIKISGQKPLLSMEYPKVALATETAESSVKNEYENQKSSTKPVNGFHKLSEDEEIVISTEKPSFGVEKLTKSIETKLKFSLDEEKLINVSKSTNDLQTSSASSVDVHSALMSNSEKSANWPIETQESILKSRNTSESSTNSEYSRDPNLVAEVIKELDMISVEMTDYKVKNQRLESELEQLKKAHAAMQINMLQKSLHAQYVYNLHRITTLIEECHKNYELCTSIQSMLMNSIGEKLPNGGEEWLKVKLELEEISKNHESKFWEINNQLCTAIEPEKLQEVNLQPETMPNMPQTKLIGIVQAAFGMYRMHQMKEFQRMQIGSMSPSSPIPTIRPQPQQIFGGPLYEQSTLDYYTQMASLGSAYRASQPNFLRPCFGSQNIRLPPRQNLANSAPINFHYNRNMLPPTFSTYTQQPNLAAYQTANPSVQLGEKTVQQTALKFPQNEPLTIVDSNTGQQIFPAVPQNAPTLNFSAFDHSTLTPATQASSAPSLPRSSSTHIQQNGQSSEEGVKLPPQRPNSVAELEHTFKQSTVKSSQPCPNFVTPEMPTFSPIRKHPSTPVQKSLSFVPQESNVELSTVKDSQRTNSTPEIPKIFITQQQESIPMQRHCASQKNQQNYEEPESSVAIKAKDQLFVDTEKSDATNHQQNWNSKILQAPLPLRDFSNANYQKDIDVRATENSLDCDKFETLLKVVNSTNNESKIVSSSSVTPKETKARKKSEHSMDKLMRKMRQQYKGVLELDLLKGIECVRKKHNNSLSRLPITRIIREADKFIVDRQQKQLCGYEKRVPNQHLTVSNANPWCMSDSERKRQTSVSPAFSASSLKREPQNSLSVKKKWEPVIIPNETWKRENPESDCAICFETMLNTASYTLQCKHTFHKICIKNWYQHNQSCPTCRVHSTIDDEYPPLPLG